MKNNKFIKSSSRIMMLMLIFVSTQITTWACPACENSQPKILRGITHGTGPQSKWDYVIILGAVLIVLVTLFFSVKWIIKPGEKSNNHIKRLILNNP